MKKQFGFIKPQITEDNYIFGSGQLAGSVLQENGQWDDFLPDFEIQRKEGFETMACTCFATLNAIEILFKRQFNATRNFSERFLGIIAENTENGNDPHKVVEVFRKNGAIEDELLPFSNGIDTWEEYYYPKPMTTDFLVKGQNFLQQYVIGHDWVFNGDIKDKPKKIKDALKYSPVCVSVDAWNKKGQYYVKDKGADDNHWTTLYGYVDGKYWKCYDHYDDSYKKLAWDYDFGFAKRYTLDVNTNPVKSTDVLNNIVSFIKDSVYSVLRTLFREKDIPSKTKIDVLIDTEKRLNLIINNMKPNETNQEALLRIAKENLGRDVTPEDNVPDEIGCAEALSTIIKKLDNDFPIIPHTMNLYKEMTRRKEFQLSLNIEAGSIIISPTGKGNPGTIGHCGIIVENNKIASNNSYTGKWEVTHTIDSWVNYYRIKRGFPIYILKMV